MANTYKITAILTIFAAIAGTWAFRQYSPTESGPRLKITDTSGAPLESFFADIPPNASIAAAIKDGPSPMGACSSRITGTLEKIGQLFDIAAPVYAQGSCCPGDLCQCLGCSRFVNPYTCGSSCDGGVYRYADYDPEMQCFGVKPDDPRNCDGQCECGVILCYNGSGCGC